MRDAPNSDVQAEQDDPLLSSRSSLHSISATRDYSLLEMAACKSKLASPVQDLTIEMPQEYLEHVR